MTTTQKIIAAIRKAEMQNRKPILLRLSKAIGEAVQSEVFARVGTARAKDSTLEVFYGVHCDLTSLAPELLCEDGTRILIQS